MGWGKAVLGFGANRTLVSMATVLPLGYNAENDIIAFSRLFLIGSFSYMQVTMTYIRIWMSSKFGWIRPQTTELAALEHLKKNPIDL